MSSIGKTKATGIYHEWQTDELNDPMNSSMVQGADFDATGPDGDTTSPADGGGTGDMSGPSANPGFKRERTRLGNYTQINGKTLSVSGTKRAVDQTGVADEYAYQLKKRGTELRRDVERDLIHNNNVSTAGSSSQKGLMAGIMSWVNDNGHVVKAAVNWFSPSQGTGGNAGTDGTGSGAIGSNGGTLTRADLTLAMVDEAMQNIYEAGGSAGRAMMSPKNRRNFSTLAQSANSNVQRDIGHDGKLRASVDLYMSDFGDIAIEPNYIMGLSHTVAMRDWTTASDTDDLDIKNFMILVYDPQWFKMATLRPLKEVDVGQKGDSTVGMIVEEQTFQCSNPKGASAIYGLSA